MLGYKINQKKWHKTIYTMTQALRATLSSNCNYSSTEGIMKSYPSTAGHRIYNTIGTLTHFHYCQIISPSLMEKLILGTHAALTILQNLPRGILRLENACLL